MTFEHLCVCIVEVAARCLKYLLVGNVICPKKKTKHKHVIYGNIYKPSVISYNFA